MTNPSTIKCKCDTLIMQDANTNAALFIFFLKKLQDPNSPTIKACKLDSAHIIITSY